MSELHKTLPKPVAITSGLIAGGSVGLLATQAIGNVLSPQIEHLLVEAADVDPHTAHGISTVAVYALDAAGIVGGAYVGCLIALEKPAEAAFLGAATVAAQVGGPHEPHAPDGSAEHPSGHADPSHHDNAFQPPQPGEEGSVEVLETTHHVF